MQSLIFTFPLVLSSPSSQGTSSLLYDVSTVRLHDLSNHTMKWESSNGSFQVIDSTLKNLIADAWGLRPDQVFGEQPWVDEERWDVIAKVSDADASVLRTVSESDQKHMEQALLVERFRLKVHGESRNGIIFNLVPAGHGIKMKQVPAPTPNDKLHQKEIPEGSFTMIFENGGIVLTAKAIGVRTLISNLAVNIGRTIVDETGLSPDARFDFILRWAPDNETGPAVQIDAPPISVALEEQLGLHLESSRGKVESLVVDHAEHPAAN